VSGESHSHVQHITALIALPAHWEEIGLTGKYPAEKFYDLTAGKTEKCTDQTNALGWKIH
jgi:hypothetical protein